MSRGMQRQISKTRDLPKPTYYVQALLGEFSEWAYDEERCLQFKGAWRELFGAPPEAPLDLEIGTGNGFHFAHYAEVNPERCFVGIEIKYKPLIQAIRRALGKGSKNARIMRYNAAMIEDLFEPGELNHVIIHHPDPWEGSIKGYKHRLIQNEFLETLFKLQKPGTHVEFKTDSREYFDWSVERFKNSPYQMTRLTYDLHNSKWADENFVTHFEKIFLKKGQPIFYCRLEKTASDHQ